MFGLPLFKRWHLIREYKMMRFRACECYFVQEPGKLFPGYWKKKYKDYIPPNFNRVKNKEYVE